MRPTPYTALETASADDLPLPAQVDLLADEVAEQERTIENLQLALHNSRRLGMATGILMARRHVDRGAAFELMSRASRRLGRKVVDVADRIIECGDLTDD